MPLCCKCQTVRVPPKPPSRRGIQRTVCDDCSSWRGVLKPKPTNCTQCGVELQHDGRERSQYCSVKCRQVRSINQRKAEGRPTTYPKPPKPPVVREGTCIICGTTFLAGARGSVRTTCSLPCRIKKDHQQRVASGKWAEQKVKRRKHEPRPCRDCGKQIRLGYRCRECNHLLRRAAGRTSEQAAKRQAVFERDGWICQLCDELIDPTVVYPDPMSPSIDHIKPLREHLAEYGPDFVDDEDNWQAAHYLCNQSKGARVAS